MTRDEAQARAISDAAARQSTFRDDPAHFAKVKAIILTTAPALDGYRVEKTIDIVTAECVFGVNFLKEIVASFTDAFGGRSKTMQGVLRDLREQCLDELRAEAQAVGGNAVIAVDLAYNQLIGHNTSMMMLVASGTAVVVRPVDER